MKNLVVQCTKLDHQSVKVIVTLFLSLCGILVFPHSLTKWLYGRTYVNIISFSVEYFVYLCVVVIRHASFVSYSFLMLPF